MWRRTRWARALLPLIFFLLLPARAPSQAPTPTDSNAPAAPSQPSQEAAPANQPSNSQSGAPAATPGGSQKKPSKEDQKRRQWSSGEQTKRMIYVVPNFAAVSAGKQLPPLSAKGKFKLATSDSFDYSSFVWTGILAAQSYALDQYPELGTGGVAYSRYYWRAFADGVSGTYFTEAIVPALTHQDPRYYTLERGSFGRRLGYALSRVVLTKTDSGSTTFNTSEVGGNALEAALSNLYYPPEERSPSKTAENWAAQIESAALNNIAKEFWPDFRRRVLRRK